MAPRLHNMHVANERVVTLIDRGQPLPVIHTRLVVETNLPPGAAELNAMTEEIVAFLQSHDEFEGADIQHIKTL